MLKFRRNFLFVTLVILLVFGSTGIAAAAVTVTGTDKAALTRAFDTLDQSGSNGNWYRTSTNDSGSLAWNEGPVLSAYLNMYEATGDKSYLDKFIIHADSVLKSRDSARGVTDYRGLSLPAWRAGSRYTLDGKYYIFAAHTGMIAAPLAEFAKIVKEENLADYRSKADVYLQAAVAAVAVHDDEWVDRGDQGYYIARKGAPVWSDGTGLPFNMYSAMGETEIYLYQATGDSIYLERATKMARHLKNNLSLDEATGAYVWNYWWGIAYSGWTQTNSPSANTPTYNGYRVVEDISHGVIEARFIEQAYQADIVFTSQDMNRFGHTVTDKLIKTTTSAAQYVNGTGTADSPMRVTGWTMLYPWAQKILEVDKLSPYNAPVGMFGLSLYCEAMSELNNWRAASTPPDSGDTTTPPDSGTTPPDSGDTTTPPDGGTTPPDNGDTTTPPDGGTTPPDNGDTITPPPPAAPKELVVNGGFSGGRTGWDAAGSGGTIGQEANGNKYIGNGYSWNLGQDLKLQSGKKYVFNARTHKGSATTEARLVVAGVDANNKLITTGALDVKYRHRGTGWESIPQAEFIVPAGAVKVRVYLLINGGSGMHYFDNISLKEASGGSTPGGTPTPGGGSTTPPPPAAPKELVVNGSFSGGRTGWDAVGSGGTIGQESNGNKYIGNGYSWNLGQDLKLQSGKKYVFNARTHKGSATTEARLVVAGVDANNKLITTGALDIRYRHRGTGWESIPQAVFTVPAGAVKVRVYLLINGGSGVHYFDNISLKAVN